MFFPSREGPNHRETSFVGNMLTNLALNRANPGLDILDRVSFSAHQLSQFLEKVVVAARSFLGETRLCTRWLGMGNPGTWDAGVPDFLVL